MTKDVTEIADTLGPYFDGFYEGNVAKLKSVFHPSCHLYCATHDPMTDFDMATVYKRVEGRTKPSERGDPREDGIISIDQSAPECAFAKIYISLGNQRFIDYLTLLKIDHRWQIITKTFTYTERPDVAPL